MTALRVLIVDDEFLVADLLTGVVEDAGHEVAGIAASADEALVQLEDARVDVAILDIRLKGPRDGIELACEIQERYPRVRYLFVSGSGEAMTRARAEGVNPMAILQKPFDQQQLVELLAQVAEAHDAAQTPVRLPG